MNSSYKATVAAVALLGVVVVSYYAFRDDPVTLTTANDEPDAPVVVMDTDRPAASAPEPAEAPPVEAPPKQDLMSRIRQHQQLVEGAAPAPRPGADVTEQEPPADEPPVWTIGVGESPIADPTDVTEVAPPAPSEPEPDTAAAEAPESQIADEEPITPAFVASTETVAPAPAAAANREATIPPQPSARADEPTTYTVDKGDTLSAIAVRLFGAERYWVDIAQANPTVDPARLRPGQVIRLPKRAELAADNEPAPPAPTNVKTHVVQAGDTLSTIAKRYYNDAGQWRVIYNHNRALIGSDENRVQAGLRLTIPPKP